MLVVVRVFSLLCSFSLSLSWPTFGVVRKSYTRDLRREYDAFSSSSLVAYKVCNGRERYSYSDKVHDVKCV